ncbi:MAG: hypothetical protein LBT40_08985 [Deltaproteobacteria bacterium]|jgi:ATP diphosphatase|nr:hypothetical protein [Deltaproteobacteria bacterium]
MTGKGKIPPPPGPSRDLASAVDRLGRLLDGLLDPERGCPWDLKQTVHTISEDILEEVYELREALLDGDPAKIREEAGDLGFLMFFLGRLSSKDPDLGFAMKDMLDAVVDKMIYRHPHVFESLEASGVPATGADSGLPSTGSGYGVPATGAYTGVPATGADSGARVSGAVSPPPGAKVQVDGGGVPAGAPPSNPEEVLRQWHALKRLERKPGGLLGSVPLDLPALARCHRLGAKAGSSGFDWETPAQVRAKLDEELGELDSELALGDWKDPARSRRIEEELGDSLAALTSLARHLGIRAEKALQGHNRRFAARVAWMEGRLAESGRTFEGSSPEELDSLWREAKTKA